MAAKRNLTMILAIVALIVDAIGFVWIPGVSLSVWLGSLGFAIVLSVGCIGSALRSGRKAALLLGILALIGAIAPILLYSKVAFICGEQGYL